MLIIKPFDYWIWMCVITTIVINLFVKMIISRYFNREKQIKSSILSTKQKMHKNILTVNSRMIMSIWLFAFLILRSSYSGCLYSIMTVSSHIKTIDTLTELAIAQRNGQIQVIVVKQTSFFQLFKV